jgi:hypothetical protein
MQRTPKAARKNPSNERLFAAGETLLRAIRSPKGFDATVPIFVGPIRQGESLPPGVCTQAEALDGMDLLVRMGYVRVPTNAARRNRSFAQFGTNPEAFHV